MVMPNFKGNKALHASQLNEIVAAIQKMIVPGSGITIQRVNNQVMISTAPTPRKTRVDTFDMPVTCSAANAEGDSTASARADHVHRIEWLTYTA